MLALELEVPVNLMFGSREREEEGTEILLIWHQPRIPISWAKFWTQHPALLPRHVRRSTTRRGFACIQRMGGRQWEEPKKSKEQE